MKKKIVLSVFVLLSLFLITGCENNTNQTNNNNSSNNQTNTNTKKVDHKIYKYVKMSKGSLLNSADRVFGRVSSAKDGNNEYDITLIAEFDTNTGKAAKITLYAYYLDSVYDVNEALEKYNTSTSEYKEYYTNVSTGKVNSNVSYLKADVDVKSHEFTQYIATYIIENQDIEKYKDRIYFSRVKNYAGDLEYKEGDNFFEESLEGIRIEWSDSEIKPF